MKKMLFLLCATLVLLLGNGDASAGENLSGMAISYGHDELVMVYDMELGTVEATILGTDTAPNLELALDGQRWVVRGTEIREDASLGSFLLVYGKNIASKKLVKLAKAEQKAWASYTKALNACNRKIGCNVKKALDGGLSNARVKAILKAGRKASTARVTWLASRNKALKRARKESKALCKMALEAFGNN